MRSIDNDHNSMEHLTPRSSPVLMSDLLTVRGPGSILTSGSLPTWSAHRQDFYASKWFRSVLLYIICSIIAEALVIFILLSPAVGFDPFGTEFDDGVTVLGIFIFPMIVAPIFFLLWIVIGGMFRSKLFR